MYKRITLPGPLEQMTTNWGAWNDRSPFSGVLEATALLPRCWQGPASPENSRGTPHLLQLLGAAGILAFWDLPVCPSPALPPPPGCSLHLWLHVASLEGPSIRCRAHPIQGDLILTWYLSGRWSDPQQRVRLSPSVTLILARGWRMLELHIVFKI